MLHVCMYVLCMYCVRISPIQTFWSKHIVLFSVWFYLDNKHSSLKVQKKMILFTAEFKEAGGGYYDIVYL